MTVGKLVFTLVGFLTGLFLGMGVGFITTPIFIVLFYIFLELFTSYDRYQVDPMPIFFWYTILFSLAAAGFCSMSAARLYKHRNFVFELDRMTGNEILSANTQSAKLVVIVIIGLITGLYVGAQLGSAASSIFILLFYILVEKFTPFSASDLDQIPVAYLSTAFCGIATAVFCATASAWLYKRRSLKRARKKC